MRSEPLVREKRDQLRTMREYWTKQLKGIEEGTITTYYDFECDKELPIGSNYMNMLLVMIHNITIRILMLDWVLDDFTDSDLYV